MNPGISWRVCVIGLAAGLLFFGCGESTSPSQGLSGPSQPALETPPVDIVPSATAVPDATEVPTQALVPPSPAPEPPTSVPSIAPTRPVLASVPAPLPEVIVPSPPLAQRVVGPTVITLHAKNLLFDQSSISAPAGSLVTLTLENEDQSVPHDVGVNIAGVAHTDTCSGPCVGQISFIAPAPGSYQFFCSLHQDMQGSFLITP